MPRTRKKGSDEAPRVEVVTFDFRRNLINILGEEHYPYAEFLYHELAANSWDEDATEVHIDEESFGGGRGRTALYDIRFTDNGNGMDYSRLQEYFRVGESGKVERQKSERFGRDLIGRIGVGKVAILKAARRWRITTERHLGLERPERLRVHVDVDAWISGEVQAFAVQFLEPTGKPGTEIALEGVKVRLRQDRILRHLQRLPLADDFQVWRNDKLIPPREWSGLEKIDIDAKAAWVEDDVEKQGSIVGEIWIRPEMSKRDSAYVAEPTSEKDGLTRQPAGIEIRVSHDVIKPQEFFGHETHAHGLNRIWGWVEVPWLPILGNRTGYLEDSPAGQAFYKAVKPYFDQAYNRVRYERDRRAQEARRKRAEGDDFVEPTADDTGDGQGPGGQQEAALEEAERVASRYGETLMKVLEEKPELAPIIMQPASTGRGRPAKDRLYPVRPTGRYEPFEADPFGNARAVTYGPLEPPPGDGNGNGGVRMVKMGRTTRDEANFPKRELGEVTTNTKAGIRLRFVPLGGLEAPYRWNLENPDELTLDINTDHSLYQLTDRPGGSLHRFLCGWLVSLALAELRNPTSATYVADFVETMSYELISKWGRRG